MVGGTIDDNRIGTLSGIHNNVVIAKLKVMHARFANAKAHAYPTQHLFARIDEVDVFVGRNDDCARGPPARLGHKACDPFNGDRLSRRTERIWRGAEKHVGGTNV